MKKFLLNLIILASLLTAPMTFTTGCQSVERSTYTAVSAANITVESALKAWNDYLAMNDVSKKTELQVVSAFKKYKAAALVVASAGKATADASGSSDALESALIGFANSRTDLINLLIELKVLTP